MRALKGFLPERCLPGPWLWWVVLALLLGFWLGAHGLTSTPLWSDEHSSVRDAGGPLSGPLSPVGVWRRVAEGNPWHAPGYFISLNLWSRLVGWDTGAVRALSLLYGVLAIAWTYRLGRDIVSVRAGVVAALLLATSMAFVHYESKLRMYTLIALVTVLLMWLYLRILTMPRAPGRRWWLALVAITILTFYTHYLAVLSLGAIGLYHLIFAPKNRRWGQVVVAVVVGALFFLPWVPALTTGVGLAGEADELHAIALSAPQLIMQMASLFANTAPLLLLAALVLSLVHAPRGVRRVWLLTLLLLAILILANELFQIISHRRLRYLLGLWPLLAVLVAVGITRLRRDVWIGLATVLWAGIGVWSVLADTTTPLLHGHDYLFPLQRVAYYVDGQTGPDDVVVNYLPDEGRRGPEYENVASYYFTPMHLAYVVAQPEDSSAEESLVDLLTSRERIWLAYAPRRAPASLPGFLGWLTAHYRLCTTRVSDDALNLALYARDAAACEAADEP